MNLVKSNRRFLLLYRDGNGLITSWNQNYVELYIIDCHKCTFGSFYFRDNCLSLYNAPFSIAHPSHGSFQLTQIVLSVDSLDPHRMTALLLDQHRLVSGVGNWVCDDVLYHSGIHPETSGNSLTLDDVRRLVDALQHVCKEACRVDADHEKFPKHWLFHARWRKVTEQPLF